MLTGVLTKQREFTSKIGGLTQMVCQENQVADDEQTRP